MTIRDVFIANCEIEYSTTTIVVDLENLHTEYIGPLSQLTRFLENTYVKRFAYYPKFDIFLVFI